MDGPVNLLEIIKARSPSQIGFCVLVLFLQVKSFQAIKNSLEEFGDTTPSTENYYHPRKVMRAMVAEQMAPVKYIILGYNPGKWCDFGITLYVLSIMFIKLCIRKRHSTAPRENLFQGFRNTTKNKENGVISMRGKIESPLRREKYEVTYP